MIVCDEGTECSAQAGASVSAYGFIDRQSVWNYSYLPCINFITLSKRFGVNPTTFGDYNGTPYFKNWQYVYAPWRGGASCDLCEKILDENGRIVLGRKYWTGIVLIPSRRISNQYYLFPVGLGHLIEAHHYVPPNDLIDALVNFVFDPNWNTKALEHKLFYSPRPIR